MVKSRQVAVGGLQRLPTAICLQHLPSSARWFWYSHQCTSMTVPIMTDLKNRRPTRKVGDVGQEIRVTKVTQGFKGSEGAKGSQKSL